MKLKEFLEACDEFEGEIYSNQLEESIHSFCYSQEYNKLTKEGEVVFNKILNSEIRISNNHIELLDKAITQQEYNLFTNAIAGYIAHSLFEKWFVFLDTKRYEVHIYKKDESVHS